MEKVWHYLASKPLLNNSKKVETNKEKRLRNESYSSCEKKSKRRRK